MTLLKMSIYGAVIILAIILIRTFTLHKLPKKFFLILWGIALLRLLVPFEISSAYSIYSLLPEQTASTGQTSEQTQTAGDLPEDLDFNSLPVNASEPTAQNTQITTSGTAGENHPFQEAMPLIWSAGALLCALHFIIAYCRCYREFCTSLPVKEPYATEWLEAHPLRRTVSIRQSDRISTPLTYGIFRPVILLPKNTDWDNRQQLDYILYHEHTHIRRFDQAAKLFLIAALCLHWFNPLVWVMYYLFNRDIELSCDECVLHNTREDRSSYAMALIHMEEKRTYTAPLFSHFSENAIEERIVAIMKMQKITFGAVLFGVLLVLVVVLTLATSAKTTNAAPDSGSDATRPKVTVTPTPTPTPNPGPTVTPTQTPDPGPTATPPPSIYPTNGSYAAIVKGCMENVLMLDFVEYDDSTGEVANPESLIVHYPVAEDVVIRLINYNAKTYNPNDYYIITDDLSVFITSVYTKYGWSTMPYFFEIEDGVIVGILEQPII